MTVNAALTGATAGPPIPAFFSVRQEAHEWASLASAAELKNYAVACYNELTPKDQANFLSHVSREVAA